MKSKRQKRSNASRRRRNVKCKGSEICRSALMTDKLNLMAKGRRRPMKWLSSSTELGRRQRHRSSEKMFRIFILVVKDNSLITIPASSNKPPKSVSST